MPRRSLSMCLVRTTVEDEMSGHVLMEAEAFDSEAKDAEVTRVREAMKDVDEEARRPRVVSISLPAPGAHREENMESYGMSSSPLSPFH